MYSSQEKYLNTVSKKSSGIFIETSQFEVYLLVIVYIGQEGPAAVAYHRERLVGYMNSYQERQLYKHCVYCVRIYHCIICNKKNSCVPEKISHTFHTVTRYCSVGFGQGLVGKHPVSRV